MIAVQSKKILGIHIKINYNSAINTDIFDYFDEDDPYKEIIVS